MKNQIRMLKRNQFPLLPGAVAPLCLWFSVPQREWHAEKLIRKLSITSLKCSLGSAFGWHFQIVSFYLNTKIKAGDYQLIAVWICKLKNRPPIILVTFIPEGQQWNLGALVLGKRKMTWNNLTVRCSIKYPAIHNMCHSKKKGAKSSHYKRFVIICISFYQCSSVYFSQHD